MGDLEKTFFSSSGETLVKYDDPDAQAICEVLKKAIGKSDWVARGGMSSKYYFNFDKIYNQVNQKRK